jgi:hypothetical protein
MGRPLRQASHPRETWTILVSEAILQPIIRERGLFKREERDGSAEHKVGQSCARVECLNAWYCYSCYPGSPKRAEETEEQ